MFLCDLPHLLARRVRTSHSQVPCKKKEGGKAFFFGVIGMTSSSESWANSSWRTGGSMVMGPRTWSLFSTIPSRVTRMCDGKCPSPERQEGHPSSSKVLLKVGVTRDSYGRIDFTPLCLLSFDDVILVFVNRLVGFLGGDALFRNLRLSPEASAMLLLSIVRRQFCSLSLSRSAWPKAAVSATVGVPRDVPFARLATNAGDLKQLLPPRPRSSCALFYKDIYPVVSAANPNLSFTDLFRICAEKWQAPFVGAEGGIRAAG